MNTEEKIQAFAKLLEAEQLQYLQLHNLTCETNVNNHKVHIRPGKKYTKVDVGNSGRYMVENSTEQIYGTKGYGVIHRGHFYGTLDGMNDYSWGDYYPIKKINPTPLREHTIPILTFAPEPNGFEA